MHKNSNHTKKKLTSWNEKPSKTILTNLYSNPTLHLGEGPKQVPDMCFNERLVNIIRGDVFNGVAGTGKGIMWYTLKLLLNQARRKENLNTKRKVNMDKFK
ncbi:hypothetical protein LCGC14_1756700 [marine sediment metagenome]|uniref:Uncharacterized protein n=1 Tax=marine sediment metagenome TaxID=412755 RepID=A0A0F9HPJ7_9ZZZZ